MKMKKEKKLDIKMLIGVKRLSLSQAKKAFDDTKLAIKGSKIMMIDNVNLLERLTYSAYLDRGKLISINKGGAIVFLSQGIEIRKSVNKNTILIIFRNGKPEYAVYAK